VAAIGSGQKHQDCASVSEKAPWTGAERQDPAAVLDQLPDLSGRLRDADDATKRALFDASDLHVVHDKASHRPSISATLTEAVASMLHNGLEPLWQVALRGWGSNPQPLD
jgi:hypothetical protein